MTSEEKNLIKEKIEGEIATLASQVEGLEKKIQPVGKDCCIDEVAREELLTEQEIDQKILNTSRRHLTELQTTLHRLDSPTFGICIECDEPIGFERMKLRPESVKCVECAGSR